MLSPAPPKKKRGSTGYGYAIGAYFDGESADSSPALSLALCQQMQSDTEQERPGIIAGQS